MAAGFLSFPVLAALSVLLMFHVILQSSLAYRDVGREWNAGPRDATPAPLGELAGRAARASANFRETYPGFVVLVLALAAGGDSSGIGFAGTLVWFVARIIYIPLYLGGVPYIRSYVWLVGASGLAMMLSGVLYSAYST
ncbi:MAPEG family protein [Rhizobium sp. LjRoot254]|uniref:MAPEG family protein n=1 Tax=Rhizobium sp. LjRoot254 TaxID=3342297 RepID=UPI003ECC97B2